MKAIALGYHDVIDARSAHERTLSCTRARYALDLEHFRAHLNSIAARAPHIAAVDGRTTWGTVPVFLTFDDGAECSRTLIADELEHRGWRGQFFVTTDWIGQPGFLSKSQIRELHQRGHGIGSHSCSHPSRMSRLSDNDLRAEWEESCAVLENILGDPIQMASIPDGYCSKRVALAASDAGIRTLFTSEPTMSCFGVNGCLVVGRYFIRRNSPALLSGDLAAGNRWPRAKQAIAWQLKKPVKFLAGERYLKLRRFILSRRSDGKTANSYVPPTLHKL